MKQINKFILCFLILIILYSIYNSCLIKYEYYTNNFPYDVKVNGDLPKKNGNNFYIPGYTLTSNILSNNPPIPYYDIIERPDDKTKPIFGQQYNITGYILTYNPSGGDNPSPSGGGDNYSQYGKTKREILSYITNILSSWPSKKNSSNGILYKTYDTPDQIRMDIYDNSLLANLLITIDEKNTPNPIVINILNIFQGGYDFLQRSENTCNSKLLSAAYYEQKNEIVPMDWDIEANAQDLGNNSMVGIALGKFCLKYPSYPNTQDYRRSLLYLINTYLVYMKCFNSKGFYRRWPPDNCMNISMEHMIDVYALGVICKKLNIDGSDELINISKSFVTDPTYFVEQTHYGIGTKKGCSGENNIDDGEPFDTQTWNMLSGVDDIESKKDSSLKWVIDNGYNSNTPGISFALSKNGNSNGCSHYENTGSLLVALNEYKNVFRKDISLTNEQSKKIDSMYKFVKDKIDNGQKINASYTQGDITGYKGCEEAGFPGCCSYISNGWMYPLKPHLGATVYCAFALLSLKTPANPYKYY